MGGRRGKVLWGLSLGRAGRAEEKFSSVGNSKLKIEARPHASISDALDVGFMRYLTDDAIFWGSGDGNLRAESKGRAEILWCSFWSVRERMGKWAKITSKTANNNIQNRKKGDISRPVNWHLVDVLRCNIMSFSDICFFDV